MYPGEIMPALCRDCLRIWESRPAPRCPACRSPRLLDHPELLTLSIAHMDCDAFYASVEKRDDPALRDLPVIVGGARRGVVSTCCYIARIRGVRSAMPMFQALKLCPDAVVIKPRMDHYVTTSRRIRTLLDQLTPAIEPLSLDEAFLDLTGTERLHHAAPAVQLARLARDIELRDRRHCLDRSQPQQVPRQDRLGPRQAARLRHHRRGRDAGVPARPAGADDLGRRPRRAGRLARGRYPQLLGSVALGPQGF